MKVTIYQIDTKKDKNNVIFMDLMHLERVYGSTEIDASIYKKVCKQLVDCASLDDVFFMFNMDLPEGYTGRTLSVSDVIKVEESNTISDGFYFVNDIGYQKIDFDAEKCSNC